MHVCQSTVRAHIPLTGTKLYHMNLNELLCLLCVWQWIHVFMSTCKVMLSQQLLSSYLGRRSHLHTVLSSYDEWLPKTHSKMSKMLRKGNLLGFGSNTNDSLKLSLPAWTQTRLSTCLWCCRCSGEWSTTIGPWSGVSPGVWGMQDLSSLSISPSPCSMIIASSGMFSNFSYWNR